jgi:hypothetical protein
MTDWVRLWHDMPADPKWRTIARKSGQRVGDVIAVFTFLMVNASGNATERGRTQGFDIEDVATALDVNESDVQAIIDAMQGKVLDGERLTGWGHRQPKREDLGASRRKSEWLERNGTQRNAEERPETETETDKEEDTNVSSTVTRARKKSPQTKFRFPESWQPEPLPEAYQSMVDVWPPGRLERMLSEFREYWLVQSTKRPGWDRTWRARIESMNDRILKETQNGHSGNFSGGGYRDRPQGRSRTSDGFTEAIGLVADQESFEPAMRSVGPERSIGFT